MSAPISFTLTTDSIALCDLLKLVGVVESGGQAKHFIAEGLVTVDGKQELRKRCQIKSGQRVQLFDVIIKVS